MKKIVITLCMMFLASYIFAQDTTKLILKDFKNLKDLQVIGIRPLRNQPVTMTQFKTDSVSSLYQGGDPFFILNRIVPGILSQSDNGSVNGYCYMRIRGMDQSRINFTLNGIPMNEMEDQGIYFSNMPGFYNNISNIQVERGLGISKYGTTSIAGSVNMETTNLADTQETTLDTKVGSYGTAYSTVQFKSGLRNRISYDISGTYGQTDGFKDNSGNRGSSIFSQIGYVDSSNIIKAFGFIGNSMNQMAYIAPTMEQIESNYKVNIDSSTEEDTFAQRFIAVNWISNTNKNLKFNSSIYYNRIKGGYTYYYYPGSDLFKNNVVSDQYGVMTNGIYTKEKLTLNFGVNFNLYDRKHSSYNLTNVNNPPFSDAIGLPDLYRNTGYKNDIVLFTRITYSITKKLSLFTDLQFRNVSFKYRGNIFINITDTSLNYNWTFLNPKIGAKYISGNHDFYLNIGLSKREPTRSDLFSGYDDVNSSNNGYSSLNSLKLKPEEVLDVEIGHEFHSKGSSEESESGFSAQQNIFLMYFHNELVGYQLNDIGVLLKQNVSRSFRSGYEFNGDYTIGKFSFGTNLSIMYSKLIKVGGLSNYIVNKDTTYSNVTPFETPTFEMNNYVNYKVSAFNFGLNGYYISKMYDDNTETSSISGIDYYSPRTYLVSGSLLINMEKISIQLNVNNIFNTKYYTPGGLNSPGASGTPTYYVGALENFMINVKIRL